MAKLTIPPYQIGNKVGYYTIMSNPFRIGLYWFYVCKCKCEKIKEVRYTHLASGAIVSCGCYSGELTSQRNFKHGYAKRGKIEELFQRWCDMRQRCNDPRKDNYQWYGGKGIKVCKAWDDYVTFRDWALINGFKNDLEIDRIDGNKDYEPSNCRWVTHQFNVQNQSRCLMITIDGNTHCLAEWARIKQISYSFVYQQLQKGLSVDKAFGTTN